MHKQMRSGRGSRDREEGVEHNYMVTKIFLPLKKSLPTW